MNIATALDAAVIAMEDVRATYGKRDILNGVTLQVGAGEVVALLGGNGAGKSTILKVLAGFLKPADGRILIGGQDVTGFDVGTRHGIGVVYMLQGGRVFPNLSAAENVEIAVRHARAAGRRPAANRIGTYFEHLQGLAQRRAGLLSGGERQMLAAEMVLAQEPEIALLDEPTGALAPDLRTLILSRVKEFARTRQAAVLLVEQNVDEARQVADRCLVLDRGLVRQETKETSHEE